MCPGVTASVMVVSPTVIFWPSVTTTSRFGLGRLACAEFAFGFGRSMRSQSSPLIAIRLLSCRMRRPAEMIEVTMADDDVNSRSPDRARLS